MKTAYETALDEFKDAAAAVRVAMSAHADARAAQITANRNYQIAADALQAATDRQARADDALMMAKPEAPNPPDIDVDRDRNRRPVSFLDGVTFVETTLNGSGE